MGSAEAAAPGDGSLKNCPLHELAYPICIFTENRFKLFAKQVIPIN